MPAPWNPPKEVRKAEFHRASIPPQYHHAELRGRQGRHRWTKAVIASRMDVNDLTYQINGAIFEVNRELGAWISVKENFSDFSSDKVVASSTV